MGTGTSHHSSHPLEDEPAPRRVDEVTIYYEVFNMKFLSDSEHPICLYRIN